jgi:hypothetical protein
MDDEDITRLRVRILDALAKSIQRLKTLERIQMPFQYMFIEMSISLGSEEGIDQLVWVALNRYEDG